MILAGSPAASRPARQAVPARLPSLGARVSYRKFYGRGNDADRYSDRDFVTFSLTKQF
jgi:hypothetical protein